MPKILGFREGTGSSTEKAEKREPGYYISRGTITRTYDVLADNLSQEEPTILATTGIPPLHSKLLGAWCIERTASEVQTVRHPITKVMTIWWEVVCKFDSDVDIDEAQKSPESRTPVVKWRGEQDDEVLEDDPVTGEPIETKAGEPIFITAPVCNPILEIERYELSPFDPGVILDYVNHVNSVPFYGAPCGYALMLPIETDPETIGGVDYERVLYRIKFRIKEEGWKVHLLHHGFKHVKQLDPRIVEVFQDRHGQPATTNLDENGQVLKPDAEPVFLSFNRFPRANLNNLNLGPFG